MTSPYDHRPADPAESLGDARVDGAVARLEELSERPVSEHVEVFDDIHARLRDALGETAAEPVTERSD